MRSFLHILKKIGKIALIIPIFALLYLIFVCLDDGFIAA